MQSVRRVCCIKNAFQEVVFLKGISLQSILTLVDYQFLGFMNHHQRSVRGRKFNFHEPSSHSS